LGVAAFDDAGCSVRSQAESPRRVKVKAKVKPEVENRRFHPPSRIRAPLT
jgi:hypothetical protein